LLAAICGFTPVARGRDERGRRDLCLSARWRRARRLAAVERYRGVEQAALVDLGVLAGFVTVALTSQRFWPLWVAGCQLTTARPWPQGDRQQSARPARPMARRSSSGAIRS
jgi:hypothetical protein